MQIPRELLIKVDTAGTTAIALSCHYLSKRMGMGTQAVSMETALKDLPDTTAVVLMQVIIIITNAPSLYNL